MNGPAESKVGIPVFLSGGGEMGECIRSMDWSSTPIGSHYQWPPGLRMAVSIMLNTPFGMFIAWGNEYTLLYNDAFRPLLGNSKHPQALGSSTYETFKEIWHVFGTMVNEAMEGHPVGFSDFMFPLERNGYKEESYFDFSFTPILDEDGAIGGVLGTVVETTEKVASLKKVEETQHQLQFVTDSAELATWDYYPLTNTFTANKRYEDWFGIRAGTDTDNELFFSMVEEKDRGRVKQAWQNSLTFESGGRFDIEYTILPPLRKRRMIRARGKAWFNADNIAYRVHGTLQDISDESASRRFLIASENNLRNIVLQAPVAMCVLKGTDYTVEIANDAMIKLWGTTKEEVLYKPLFVGRPEARGQGLEELLHLVYTTGESFSAHERPMQLPRNGRMQLTYINFIYTTLRESDGSITGIVAVGTDVTDQVVSRKKIEESEQRFRTLITGAPVATGLYLGPDNRIQYVNDIMIGYWGKDSSIVGKTLREAVPELEGQPFFDLLEKVYQTGIVYNSEESPANLKVDGQLKTFYFNFTYSALRDTNGKIYGIHHTAIDVTEKVIAKQKLLESEENLRQLVMQAPVGICIVKGDPFYVEVINDSFLELLGRPRSDFSGKPFWEVLHELAEYYAPILINVAKTGIPFHGTEHQLELPRGGKNEFVYIDFVCEPIKESDGSINTVMIIAIDVTDKVVARKNIEDSEQRFRVLAETLPQLVWMTDASGKQLYASFRWKEYTGLDPTGPDTWQQMVHPHDINGISRAWSHSISNGTNYNAEVRLKHKSGVYRWHFVQGEPVKNEKGEIVRWIGAFTDIHDQKSITEKLESVVTLRTAELQRSNEDLQQFAHVASHDLKEPLRKIKTFANRLEDDRETTLSEKGSVYLSKIYSASDRLFSMVDGVLRYSTIDAHDEPIESVDLNEIIRNIETDLEILIQQKDAIIQTEPLPRIQGFSVLLYQLFYNLVNNSLKFASPGVQPCISISSALIPDTRDPSFIEITFRDNGIGFDQTHAERIFNPFTRLHPKDRYEGTGLGLALCKKNCAAAQWYHNW